MGIPPEQSWTLYQLWQEANRVAVEAEERYWSALEEEAEEIIPMLADEARRLRAFANEKLKAAMDAMWGNPL